MRPRTHLRLLFTDRSYIWQVQKFSPRHLGRPTNALNAARLSRLRSQQLGQTSRISCHDKYAAFLRVPENAYQLMRGRTEASFVPGVGRTIPWSQTAIPAYDWAPYPRRQVRRATVTGVVTGTNG